MITIKDKDFEVSITSAKIQERITSLADDITADLKGTVPVFLPVLNGSFLFASDLIRRYSGECIVSFIKVSSYEGVSTTGTVTAMIGLSEDIKGKTVVLVEDIVDTGITIEVLIEELKKFNPAKIKIATLLFKPDAYRKEALIDYIGFRVPNDFLVGYGLDYDGLGRNLEDIYVLKQSQK